jgi:hypothetical protein
MRELRTISASSAGDIRVLLGDGDDEFFSDDPGVSTARGGSGEDVLSGGPDADRVIR